MSAFIVSDRTITAIVDAMDRAATGTAFAINGRGARTSRRELGQALLDQNYASVNHRYHEVSAPHHFELDWPTDEIETPDGVKIRTRHYYTPAEWFGAIQCYEYQACETPGYDNSEIHRVLGWVKDAITEQLFRERGETCPWGID